MSFLSGWGTQPWGSGPSAGGGTAPPVVSNITPTPGTLLQPDTAVHFDVTDSDSAIRRTVIWISYPNKSVVELVFDGVSFAPHFSGSSRIAITNGFHYNVTHGAGWPDTGITITVEAIDVTGQEN